MIHNTSTNEDRAAYEPPLGTNGNTLKTTVCDEIERSVQRSLEIEKLLALPKVKLDD